MSISDVGSSISISTSSCGAISDGSFFFSKWIDWYKYGKYSDATDGSIVWNSDNFNKYKKHFEKRSDFNLFEKEYFLYKSLRVATSTALKHYVYVKNVNLPDNWYLTYPTLAKYNPGFSIDQHNHAMNFHTDYNIRDHWFSGSKFYLTSTSYLNDNYNGGEICFFKNKSIIKYKPEAGDIIVFPSGDPSLGLDNLYYHGVNKVVDGHKLLVRAYLRYISLNGEDNLSKCINYYGEQTWKKIYKNLTFINNLNYDQLLQYMDGIIEELPPQEYCKNFYVEMYEKYI